MKCDLMVMKWILNPLEKGIREGLQYGSISKELWTEILDRYGQTNTLEIYELKKDLSSITQNHFCLLSIIADSRGLGRPLTHWIPFLFVLVVLWRLAHVRCSSKSLKRRLMTN
ncbi:hypothetical protein RND81_04G063900 [Saponaria officinalis]|uniref:Uncharacterized protein n=1 Tax=Saponaria officinalis TaxID=3572 RepID=A0AAW1LCY3_SAPOF